MSCEFTREALSDLTAPLYPGKQQEWILILPLKDLGGGSKEEADKELFQYVERWFQLVGSRFGLYTSAIASSNVRSLRVVSNVRHTPPAESFLRSRVIAVSPYAPMTGVMYVGVRFTAEGSATRIDWPWDYIGSCPSSIGLGGLYAVFPPSEAPPPEPGILERAEEMLPSSDDIQTAAENAGKAIGSVLSPLLWLVGGLVVLRALDFLPKQRGKSR